MSNSQTRFWRLSDFVKNKPIYTQIIILYKME